MAPVAETFPLLPIYSERFPAIGGIFMLMVTQDQISPARLRAGMKATRHKFLSLSVALGCSDRALRDFAKGRSKALYCVQMEDLKRELRLEQVA